jgi:hypothetical protein
VSFHFNQPPSVPFSRAEELIFAEEFRFGGESLNGDSVPIGENTPVRVGNELRIVGFGDSFIRANGADYNRSLLPRVAAYLNQQSPDRQLQLYNLGEPSNYWEMDCRYWDVGRLLAPDIVMWVFVLNDIEHEDNTWDIDNDLINDDYLRENRGVGLMLWDTPMRLWVERRLTRESIDWYQSTYNPRYNGKNLREFEDRIGRIIHDTNSRGARFVFVIFPLLYSLYDYPFLAAHDELRRIVEGQGGEVVDLAPSFIGRKASQLWVNQADYHPNDYGHWIAAQAIINALKDTPSPLSTAPECSYELGLNPVDDGTGHGLDAELYSARKAHCEAPEDPNLVLDLAEKELEIMELSSKQRENDYVGPICAEFKQFHINALWAAALLKDRQDPEANAVKARARGLMERHRSASAVPR